MKKLMFALVLVMLFSGLFAQAPQGITHQAVIRNVANELVTQTEIGIRVSIIQGEPGPDETIVYQETHLPQSNAHGLITYLIGHGTAISGDFAAIDWAAGPYFLKNEVDPAGGTSYTITGTTQFLSVPYALHAGSTSDNQWEQSGNNIFTRNTGNVGIGINNPVNKLEVDGNARFGWQGAGFIGIGGDFLGGEMGLFDITGDKILAGKFYSGPASGTYVFGDNLFIKSGNVGIGTSNPSALFHAFGTGTGEGNVLFEGSHKFTNPGDPPASQANTRMMWYPDKAAFRGGTNILQNWSKDSIGFHSVAMGQNATAAGSSSFAVGSNVSSSGPGSVAIGSNASATGFAAMAIGSESEATGTGSIAIGRGLKALSGYEFVVGSFNTEYDPIYSQDWWEGDRLFVIGNGEMDYIGDPPYPILRSNALTMLKNGHMGLGVDEPSVRLDIDGQVKIRGGNPGTGKVLTSDEEGVGTWEEAPPGSNWTASESNIYRLEGNVGIGTLTPSTLLHVKSTGFMGGVVFEGDFQQFPAIPPVTGFGTRMMWYPNKAAFRVGSVTNDFWDKDNVGNYSIAMGLNTKALGSASVAFGNNAVSEGNTSIALGYLATARGDYSTALGYLSNAEGLTSMALGDRVEAQGNYSFVLGSTSNANGNYSFVLGGSSNAIGDYSTAIGYETNAYGKNSLAIGVGIIAASGYETAIGHWNSEYNIESLDGWDPNDRLFSIGNGSELSRKNAVTFLKNGKMGIGIDRPLALFHVNSTEVGEGNVVFVGKSGSSNNHGEPPVSGSGTRMMWYPGKAAFRVGSVNSTQWDNNNIGFNSVAMGINTLARGSSSVALGHNAIASGQSSFAIGNGSKAAGTSSFHINLYYHPKVPTIQRDYMFAVTGASVIGGNRPWASFSDIRFKEIINYLEEENNIEKILNLKGVRFKWIDLNEDEKEFSKEYLGFIAQEVDKLIPESVIYDEDNDIFSMEHTAIIPVLVEAIKEQQATIELLIKRIEALEVKIE